ncbi:MAG: hypothetical protein WBV21_10910, partial [Desulfobacterales bacterium]
HDNDNDAHGPARQTFILTIGFAHKFLTFGLLGSLSPNSSVLKIIDDGKINMVKVFTRGETAFHKSYGARFLDAVRGAVWNPLHLQLKSGAHQTY